MRGLCIDGVSTAVENIFNYLRIDERLSSSGQPDAEQLIALKAGGISVIINLAPHSHPKSLPNETELCDDLGLTYINIPVAFDNPLEAQFQQFCAVMKRYENRKVHIHCIVNARVTAFLYRFDCEVRKIDKARAQKSMQKIWQPGGIWARFINDYDRINADHLYAIRDYPRQAD